jgi:hypothetical protein
MSFPEFQNLYGNIAIYIFLETFQAVFWPGLHEQDIAISQHLFGFFLYFLTFSSIDPVV